MALLQLNVDANLKKAIQKKATLYGVPASSLIRIVLVKNFMEEPSLKIKPGNIFNADRDNNGKGLLIDDLLDFTEGGKQKGIAAKNLLNAMLDFKKKYG